ncbi:MAG: hypothetical protein WDN00_12605 [Limisphaerales bacterium]
MSPIDPNYDQKVSQQRSALDALASLPASDAANDLAIRAQIQANYAAQTANKMRLSISKAQEICADSSATLAKYGIYPPTGSDVQFPAFSLKSEMDAERVKNPDLKYVPMSREVSVIEKAIGIKSDPPSLDEKTVKFLIQCADDGQDAPQYNLGLRYLEGRGVVKDYDKGIEYLKKSAAQGNSDAKNRLNELGVKP